MWLIALCKLVHSASLGLRGQNSRRALFWLAVKVSVGVEARDAEFLQLSNNALCYHPLPSTISSFQFNGDHIHSRATQAQN